MQYFLWFPFFVTISISRAFVIPGFQSKVEVDEDGVPLVKFGPRREGMIQNEVFVKPAKVRGVIPVIDNVGVVESDGDYEKESGSSHILPVSPEKQNKKGKSKRKKGKKKHQSIKSKKIKIEQ